MPNRPEAAPKRRRGRPRASESANRREQIVAAAADCAKGCVARNHA
jgi:hypothetical protein